MPIELRIGHNHDGQKMEVFEGLTAVLENIQLDRFAQVRFSGTSKSVSAAPLTQENLREMGLDNPNGDPIVMVHREDKKDHQTEQLKRCYRVIRWDEIEWIFQPRWCQVDDLYTYFRKGE